MYCRLTLIAVTILGTIAANGNTAASQTVDELLRRQNEEQQKQVARIVQLTKPLTECVKRHAHELYVSAEKAAVLSRAAVGLCSREEAAYRSALFQLATIMTDFNAAAKAQETHGQLVELALTIIVEERRR